MNANATNYPQGLQMLVPCLFDLVLNYAMTAVKFIPMNG